MSTSSDVPHFFRKLTSSSPTSFIDQKSDKICSLQARENSSLVTSRSPVEVVTRPPQNNLVSGTTSCPSWPFQRKIPCPVQIRARAGLNFCRVRSRSCRSQRTRSSLVSGRSSCPVVPNYKKVVPCTVSLSTQTCLLTKLLFKLTIRNYYSN